MLREMTSAELVGWYVYLQERKKEEASRASRGDYHAAQIVQALYLVMAGKTISLDDIRLRWAQQKGVSKKTAEMNEIIARAIVAANNAHHEELERKRRRLEEQT